MKKKGQKDPDCKDCQDGFCKKHMVYKSLDDVMGVDKGRRMVRTVAGARHFGMAIGTWIQSGSGSKYERGEARRTKRAKKDEEKRLRYQAYIEERERKRNRRFKHGRVM